MNSVEKNNKKGLDYTKSIAVLMSMAIVFLFSIKKVFTSKQIAYYVGFGTLLGYAWTLLVNNFWEVPAWSFTKVSVIGWTWFNTVFEDYLFYPVTSVIFLWINVKSESWFKLNENKLITMIIFALYIIVSIAFCFVDSVGMSVSVFFSIPTIIMFYFVWEKVNCYRLLAMSAIVLPLSSLWDLYSTTWAQMIGMNTQWYYPKELYVGWILNSPISITPWFTLSCISFSYSLYLVVKKYVK